MKKSFSDKMTAAIVIIVLMILFAIGIKLYKYESSKMKDEPQTGETAMLDPDDDEDITQQTNPNDDGFGTEVSM